MRRSPPSPRLRSAALVVSLGLSTVAAARAGEPQRGGPAPEGMVLIPGGEFIMGTNDARSMRNEGPEHRVRVDSFFMDATDVTNSQFRDFVKATGYKTIAERPVDWDELKKQLPPGTPRPPAEKLLPGSLVYTPPAQAVDTTDMSNWWTWTTGADWQHPQGPASNIDGKDDLPVVQIAWDDAVAYAAWAHKRLPTEAEWEYAARGGRSVPTRYWWGDEFKPSSGPYANKFMCNTFTGTFPVKDTGEDGFTRQSPVKAFPPNDYGLYDMAGNVWQWTADLYRADAHAIAAQDLARRGGSYIDNPSGPRECFNPTRDVPGAIERVTKGGSFLCNPSYCESYRPTARRGTPPDTGTEHIGFRCVKSLPLAAWSDGPSKAAILDFVAQVTTPGSPAFVPVENRIAVFDDDGTLWCEQPASIHLLFAIDRIKAMAAQHPEWKEREPFKSVLNNDLKGVQAAGEEGLMKLVAASRAGVTTEKFNANVKEWLRTGRHSRFNQPYAQCTYQPMLDLLSYLRENGFKTLVVSGVAVEFTRAFAAEACGVSPEQVIAVGDLAASELNGRHPIFLAANSDGDLSLLGDTGAGAVPRFTLIVHHTDGEREFAYDRDSSTGRLSTVLDEAPKRGWTVVDIKREWKSIFPGR